MKTFTATPETIKQEWFVVDAQNMVLGRLASKVSSLLRGKHKPEYTPHMDTGDYIIVINAEKVHVTGRKETSKMYYHHSGYPGGMKAIRLDKMRQETPERMIEIAVKGMLPKGPLGRVMFRKLKVYVGSAHKHTAQQPTLLNLKG